MKMILYVVWVLFVIAAAFAVVRAVRTTKREEQQAAPHLGRSLHRGHPGLLRAAVGLGDGGSEAPRVRPVPSGGRA